jgi:hypothetical protein
VLAGRNREKNREKTLHISTSTSRSIKPIRTSSTPRAPHKHMQIEWMRGRWNDKFGILTSEAKLFEQN